MQRCQPVEQFWLVRLVGATHGSRDLAQLGLETTQHRHQIAGKRQGQQRHDTIGVGLQQALHRPSALARGHAVVEHQHPPKAVGVNAKVGKRPALAAGHLSPDQGLLLKWSADNLSSPGQELGTGSIST